MPVEPAKPSRAVKALPAPQDDRDQMIVTLRARIVELEREVSVLRGLAIDSVHTPPPIKASEDRSAYMREYRKRAKEAKK